MVPTGPDPNRRSRLAVIALIIDAGQGRPLVAPLVVVIAAEAVTTSNRR